jgi:hypothetical protein
MQSALGKEELLSFFSTMGKEDATMRSMNTIRCTSFQERKRRSERDGKHRRILLITFALLGWLWSGYPAHAFDQVVTLPLSRPTASCATGSFPLLEQHYILTESADQGAAAAALVLFPGGTGKLGVADGELGINAANFLLRSRHLFAAQGFHVAVMDAAADFLTCPGGLIGQRTSAEFTQDMQAVIEDLRNRYPGLPVWVVGTSRGSTAAAQAGASITPPPAGVILTSSITGATIEPVFDVPLSLITAPTLIVAHQQDGCSVTPPSGVLQIKQALTGSSKVGTRQFEGGLPPLDADPCAALTQHGFLGLEPKVVEKITKWIRGKD